MENIEDLREKVARLNALAEDAAQSSTISRQEWQDRENAVKAAQVVLEAHPDYYK